MSNGSRVVQALKGTCTFGWDDPCYLYNWHLEPTGRFFGNFSLNSFAMHERLMDGVCMLCLEETMSFCRLVSLPRSE